MYEEKPQCLADNRASVEFLFAIASIQFGLLDRFAALSFNATKMMVENCLEQTKALLDAKDVQEQISLNMAAAQPSAEYAIAFVRSAYAVAVQANREIIKAMVARADELGQSIFETLEYIEGLNTE